jgi:hypothetical protein
MSRRYGLMNRKATEAQLGMAKWAWLLMKRITKNASIFRLVLMTKKNGWRRNRKQCLSNREMSGWQVKQLEGMMDLPSWRSFWVVLAKDSWTLISLFGVLQLPTVQLEDALKEYPTLRGPLATHANQTAVRPTVPRLLNFPISPETLFV